MRRPSVAPTADSDGSIRTFTIGLLTREMFYSLTSRLGCCKVYAAVFFCTAAASVSCAQTFTSFYTFTSSAVGSSPYVPPIQGLDGNFYGTTVIGGAQGRGTVFKVTPSGELTTLYSFCSQSNCSDGWFPTTQLIQATDGNFYGTVTQGGAVNFNCLDGCGTIFKITPSGTVRVLHRFCAQMGFDCLDGQFPSGALVQATDGNFYGTTLSGGQYSMGTVFRLTPAGILTTLYSFCPGEGACPDGSEPLAGLIQAKDGNLYGTTSGVTVLADCLQEYSCGTVFKITLDGTLSTIYNFCNLTGCADGRNPTSGLVQAVDGNFYGTTMGGGASANSQCQQGCGTFFKLTPDGQVTTIASFCNETDCADGSQPAATPIQGTDGNFYGTTSTGGAFGGEFYGGTVYRVRSGSTLNTIHSFQYSTDTAEPAGLFQATNGVFYGADPEGDSSFGYIYKLNTGLRAFVRTLPTAASVGARVLIEGTQFATVTAVNFNGTPATFTRVSPTEIKTAVPSGATTGTVAVTSTNGTLLSNVAFRVLP
jgi:uncharacterized repeat protein (TIGR03803 family)